MANIGTNDWRTANVVGAGDGVGTCHGMSLQDDTGNPVGTRHGVSSHKIDVSEKRYINTAIRLLL